MRVSEFVCSRCKDVYEEVWGDESICDECLYELELEEAPVGLELKVRSVVEMGAYAFSACSFTGWLLMAHLRAIELARAEGRQEIIDTTVEQYKRDILACRAEREGR